MDSCGDVHWCVGRPGWTVAVISTGVGRPGWTGAVMSTGVSRPGWTGAVLPRQVTWLEGDASSRSMTATTSGCLGLAGGESDVRLTEC